MKFAKTTTAAAMALASIAVAAPALAATGDKVYNATNVQSSLGTTQCSVADADTNLAGGPFPNTTDITVRTYNYGSNCVSRVRLSYVKNGVWYQTPYYEAWGKDKGVIFSLTNIHRCYTAFGVRRSDGSWFTDYQYPSSKHSACP